MSEPTITPKETLDTLLGLLGYGFEIKEARSGDGITLQVYTGESERLIGREGRTLDDLQYLVNRLLPLGAERVTVDVEHWREMQDDKLVQRVKQMADIVRQTGRQITLEPMNGYERRLVHNTFKDDPEIVTYSPKDDSRIKRITLRSRKAAL